MDKPSPCPTCQGPVPAGPEGGKHRPFCSARCQLIDLGQWLGERYQVPGEPAEVPDADEGNDPER